MERGLEAVQARPEKNVVYLLAYESPDAQELAVDSVESGLDIIPLSWVLGVEQLKEAEHKRLVNVLLCNSGLHLRALQEPQEESIYQLRKGGRT